MSARRSEWGGAIPKIANARLAWTERRGIILTLEAEGVTGHGEATPLPGYGGGTLDAARAALDAAPIAELLRLDSRESIEAALRIEVPAARFCLETALFDRLARRSGIPLADFLADRPISMPVPRARFGGTLGSERVVDERPLKLKVTGDEREAESLRGLRERHPNLELRLDLNGALDLEHARRALEMYARFGVRWVEEPVAGRALLELGSTPVPWLADESLTDPVLADELVSSDACAGVVLKPTLLGLGRARALAEHALARGKVALVSHAFEGPVALAACAELALSLGLQHACGIDGHAALSAFPPADLPQLPDGGEIEPVPRVGLGLTWR